MDDELDGLLVKVRADTSGFARDVAAMRAELGGPFAAAADAAGRRLEGALTRALVTGKIGFEDLKRTALSVLAEIASAAIGSGISALFGGKGAGGGLGGGLGAILGGLIGAPGRATGGPVSPGRAYLIGERGPEYFVPTAAGRVETAAPGGGARDVRLTININAPAGDGARALAASGRQVARAVRRTLQRLD
jgi:hypothetical protein